MGPGLPPPDAYRLPDALGYLLHRNARGLRAMAEKSFSRDSELGFTQFISLMLLRDGLAQTPGDIARQLSASTGATTRMLDQLEGRGLIQRDRSCRDRRSISLTLTDEGLAQVRLALPRLIALWTQILAGFTTEEYETMLALQRKLHHAIIALEAAPDEPGA